MEEFHPRRKMANAYFLVLASLQTVPEITNTFRVPTILLPLSVVVIVDAVFAILEVREVEKTNRKKTVVVLSCAVMFLHNAA